MLARMNKQTSKQHNLWIVALTALIAAAVLPVAARFSMPTTPVLGPAKVDFGKLPLSFEPNEGQTDESVRFLTHSSGGTLYFTPGEVVLSLPSGTKGERDQERDVGGPVEDAQISTPSQQSVVHMQFVDANPSTIIQSGDLLPGKVNYFIGNDPSKWQSNVPTYSGVTYTGLYAGIDLQYAGDGSQLKGTYTVAAGSDPSQIRWQYSGAEKVSVDGTGNLQIVVAGATEGSEAVTVTEQAPVAWQEIEGKRIPVSARYLVAPDQSIGFVLGSYDHNHPLIIDPTLTYSTYLGGSSTDDGRGIAVDASGNAYVTGYTASINFPIQNPFQPTIGGTQDVFVTKFSTTGSTLIYSTYLGGSGSGYDVGRGIAVDASGNAYVTGTTSSTNFPLQNPFQPTFGGYNDVFVTKLSATGSTLIYSTYLGGSGYDEGNGITVDASGNAYVTGNTYSTNFPLQNPFQSTYFGIGDAFVTRFSATGSTLIYSTYLGGNDNEYGYGIAVDTSGNAYVTGYTLSTNFPLQDPFQPTHGGSIDVFVTKFSATGTTLIYSTYLGGSGTNVEVGRGIAVDASGNAYVTGYTDSTNFPLQNPFQPTFGGGENDVFVTKFNATGSTLLYSTYLGGSSSEHGYGLDDYGIAVDTSGNAYVTGNTYSTDFPLQNPFQPTFGGTQDVFVTKFSATGSTLIYSTYLGGSGYDGGRDIAVDTSGNAYVTGFTVSTNFPLQNPFQPTSGGGYDAFVAKISDQPISTPTSTSVPPTSTSTATPVPPTGTPSSCVRKADICHRTGNGSYHQISVSCNTLPGHIEHGDIYPVPSGGCPGDGISQPVFPDVPTTNTFYSYVGDKYEMGAISGYADGTFRPNNTATRAQVAKMAVLASGISMEGSTSNVQHFADVEPSSPFFTYIEAAYASGWGWVSGYSDGTFRPNENVTRGQIAKIAVEAGDMEDMSNGTQSFSDVPIGSTFYRYIETAYANGILSGYEDGTFRPNNDATRGQVSKIFDLASDTTNH